MSFIPTRSSYRRRRRTVGGGIPAFIHTQTPVSQSAHHNHFSQDAASANTTDESSSPSSSLPQKMNHGRLKATGLLFPSSRCSRSRSRVVSSSSQWWQRIIVKRSKDKGSQLGKQPPEPKQPPPIPSKLFRFVIVGDQHVGKTSLVHQFIHRNPATTTELTNKMTNEIASNSNNDTSINSRSTTTEDTFYKTVANHNNNTPRKRNIAGNKVQNKIDDDVVDDTDSETMPSTADSASRLQGVLGNTRLAQKQACKSQKNESTGTHPSNTWSVEYSKKDLSFWHFQAHAEMTNSTGPVGGDHETRTSGMTRSDSRVPICCRVQLYDLDMALDPFGGGGRERGTDHPHMAENGSPNKNNRIELVALMEKAAVLVIVATLEYGLEHMVEAVERWHESLLRSLTSDVSFRDNKRIILLVNKSDLLSSTTPSSSASVPVFSSSASRPYQYDRRQQYRSTITAVSEASAASSRRSGVSISYWIHLGTQLQLLCQRLNLGACYLTSAGCGIVGLRSNDDDDVDSSRLSTEDDKSFLDEHDDMVLDMEEVLMTEMRLLLGSSQ